MPTNFITRFYNIVIVSRPYAEEWSLFQFFYPTANITHLLSSVALMSEIQFLEKCFV